MPKRTLFTNITPLPPNVTREVAVAMLHDHDEMIELNPLVVEHHPIRTPRDAPADEFLDCVWQELTDKIHYLPGGLVKGRVSYKACFHDLPYGLQTHIYAPLGLDIREKWSIGGTLPGEVPEPREIGLDVPRQGLYLREDGDMRCNIMLTGFVRKNLDHAHLVLVERILKKAQRIEEYRERMSQRTSQRSSTIYSIQTPPRSPGGFQAGSHMANSRIPTSPTLARSPTFPQTLSAEQYTALLAIHPALRQEETTQSNGQTLPYYPISNQYCNLYPEEKLRRKPLQKIKNVAELPGSTYHTGHVPAQQSSENGKRRSDRSELNGNEAMMSSSTPQSPSDRGSMISEPSLGSYKYYSQEYVTSGYSSRTSSAESSEDTDRAPRLPGRKEASIPQQLR